MKKKKFEVYHAVKPTFIGKLCGEYELVDIIYADSHEEVFTLTQGNKNYRSTSVGDYVVDFYTRDVFICKGYGWTETTMLDVQKHNEAVQLS